MFWYQVDHSVRVYKGRLHLHINIQTVLTSTDRGYLRASILYQLCCTTNTAVGKYTHERRFWAFTFTHSRLLVGLSLSSSRWERTHSLLYRQRPQGQACIALLGIACQAGFCTQRQARRLGERGSTSFRHFRAIHSTPCLRVLGAPAIGPCLLRTELFFPPSASSTSDSWGCLSFDSQHNPAPSTASERCHGFTRDSKARDHLYEYTCFI